MRKFWIIAALSGAGTVAAQGGGPAGYALLDDRGPLVATEVLVPGDARSALRAALIFPGAGRMTWLSFRMSRRTRAGRLS